ncbi:hypothetical protein METHPM2_1540005 [Pseudomonas sp. PM2]
MLLCLTAFLRRTWSVCRFFLPVKNLKHIPVLKVGAGLPAIAIYQLAHLWLIHRYRRQASSHNFNRCLVG